MNTIKPHLDNPPAPDHIPQDALRRQQETEARWQSFEHGAPETGAGDEMDIGDDTDPAKD